MNTDDDSISLAVDQSLEFLDDAWTQAALSAEKALGVPQGLMSFASDGRGRPTREQESLYLSAVTFTYAVWESYAEDISVELSKFLSIQLPADAIPAPVKKSLSNRDAWQLAVHPGWRSLWAQEVEKSAKGRPGSGHGINTASYANVERLFGLAGIGDALPSRLAATTGTHLGGFRKTPTGVEVAKDGTVDVEHCLELLISLRGEAVHTAKTTNKLLKNEVLWWTAFVRDLHEDVDCRARGNVIRLLTPKP